MSVKDFSDLGRIEAIRSLYEGSAYKAFDRPVFETSGKSFIRTHSALFIEGTDFDLTYFPLPHLGHKCVTAVTGQLVADVAHPRDLNVVLGVSSKLGYSHISELWKGISGAAKEYGYSKVFLDLIPSRNGLTISISAVGETSFNMEKSKPEPKSMDLICVSGSLGASYIGMSVLEREKHRFEQSGGNSQQPDLEKYRMFIGAYLKPELNTSVVSHIEETGLVPSAGRLIIHGLADAVKQLSRDTGLGAKIYTSKIPFEGNSIDFGKELNIDPISAAMNGGDDYKVLFTVPIIKAEDFRRDFQTFDVIGHLAQAEAGAVLVTPDGAELPLRSPGWKDMDED